MAKEDKLKRLLGQDYETFMARKSIKWVGPFTIDSLLDNCLNDSHPWPPKANAVYLVSGKGWKTSPWADCVPLYVGSNTGKSARFCTRVGDLIADMFRFFAHSSGGQSLYYHCKEKGLNPKRLYIAWADCGCMRCAENFLYDELEPALNKVRPKRCQAHKENEKYSVAFGA